MNRIRNRLIAAFLAATAAPLVVTLWITASLLDRSLNYATTEELDQLSKSLEEVGRQYYQSTKESLRANALAGGAPAETFDEQHRSNWPESIAAFWNSGENELVALTGTDGDRLDYLVRRGGEIRRYSAPLGTVHMEQLSRQYRSARELVQQAGGRDLRRGFTTTLILLTAAIWMAAFGSMVYLANRMSRPIHELTAGLAALASGKLDTRIPNARRDELGRAIGAFNNTAAELERSRQRLVYLTQVASWQALARKMAHELKNSLTPIRLTVEEILARQPAANRPFMDQAARIVVGEIETLERRVRAFSEFSGEPQPRLVRLEINGRLEERMAFLKSGHPDIRYDTELQTNLPEIQADPDLLNGILTNLLENAAEAAGPGGRVLGRTVMVDGAVSCEIHDSGPGLNAEAARTLFEPTITFKKGGMGLGLSIARKNALLCGGDLAAIHGRLGGAAFRITLPKA